MEGKEAYPVYPGWETVRLIGRGSFGAVYEIQRTLFGKVEKAALKQISIPQDQSDVEELYSSGYDEASITAHYQSFLADIVKEYQMMVEMKGHTNVVNCDDIRYVQRDSGVGWDIYMKMELLTPMMKSLDLVADEKQVIKLGKDMASALVLCRHRNIIHRDIKPQNIFVSKDGDFKLGDFGIAKTAEKTSGGTKIGTYNYMAPEVYNNQPYGHEADIYSLGMVMYWLLNERRLPFYPDPPAVPKSSDMDRARLRRFQGEPIPAPLHGSPALQQIVLKACAFDPKDRYRSAEDMLRELDELGRPGNAYGLGFPTGIGSAADEEEPGTVGISFGVAEAAAFPAEGEEPVRFVGQEQLYAEDSTVGVYAQPEQIETGRPAKKAKKEKKKKPEQQAVKAVPEQDGEKPKKKKTGLIIGILAAVLGIAALLGFLLYPRYGAWSEWSTVKPNEIDGRKIETGTESRYRDYTLVSTTERSQVVGEIDHEAMELAAWSDWSEWQTEPIEASENRQVEMGVQYRTQSKETTTSDQKNLEGWTLSGKETVEDYGQWHAWSTEKPGYKDGRKTSSKTQYLANFDVYKNGSYYTWYYATSSSDWRDTMDYGADGAFYTSYTSNGDTYRLYTDYFYRTVYSYSDLEEKTVYSFYRWSDWSEWSMEEPEADDDTKVETRTVYHSRVKISAPVYYYYDWGEWSDWIQGTETATDTRQVETRTVYRYADRD
jgi:hypothetical protein